jgi:hypothetical protein
MPTRDKYPRDYFESNPFEGEDPENVYRRIRWGKEPDSVREIEAPEPLVSLGDAAAVVLTQGVACLFDEGEADLAVGVESNKVYIVPKGLEEIPKDNYEYLGESRQIDYISVKGDEDGYYYHEHEKPYPKVYIHAVSGVLVVEPSEHEGRRSYAVSDEGIIG